MPRPPSVKDLDERLRAVEAKVGLVVYLWGIVWKALVPVIVAWASGLLRHFGGGSG